MRFAWRRRLDTLADDPATAPLLPGSSSLPERQTRPARQPRRQPRQPRPLSPFWLSYISTLAQRMRVLEAQRDQARHQRDLLDLAINQHRCPPAGFPAGREREDAG